MKARRDHDSKRTSDAWTLFAHALTGAAFATLTLSIVEMVQNDSDSYNPTSAAQARACPLSASPHACDACMLTKCEASCLACANEPACLRLFSCMMDCTDAACETACVVRDPDGRDELTAFLGEKGCLVQQCAAACP